MSIKIKMEFESDYRAKVLHIRFSEKIHIEQADSIIEIRSQWMSALHSWHSPYKAIIDCQNLSLEQKLEIQESFTRTIKVLKGFSLKRLLALV